MKTVARYWLPPFVWMAVIWGLSTDVGSLEHTGRLFHWIASWLVPWATPPQIEWAHGVARKLGHLTEYAILAGLWFRALHVGRRVGPPTSAWLALALSVAWAVLDEWHQAMVPSRAASAVDVAIDTAGATLGVLAARLGEASSRRSRRDARGPWDEARGAGPGRVRA